MEDIILIGFGGHAKSMADCIERENKYHIIGYTDISACVSKYPYLGTDDVLNKYYEQGVRYAALCIGYLGKGSVRQNIYHAAKKIGYKFPIISDPSSVISTSAEIGEGVFIGKRAVVNAEAKIGKMAIINTCALIEHECEIGEFTHVAVGAVLCGQVHVGNNALIGANATVIQQRIVTDGQIVPAGVTIR